MMGLGFPELLVIAVIFLFLFGGKRIATLGKDVGGGIANLRDSMKELHRDDDESEP